MDEHDRIADRMADRMKANEAHLRAVAYRMLGSVSEAEDAVQEAWIRLDRTDTSDIANLRGWLTTVVSRVCLDMLRARKSRREELLGAELAPTAPDAEASRDPEADVVMADSVGVALLVVLETLPPAERIAFVLHDLFDLSFEEIAPIVERTPTAARQLASRARRRVQGTDAVPRDLDRQREVVDAFIAASRDGDFDALLALLDPDVLLRADRIAMPTGVAAEIRGADAVARRARSGRDPRGRVMLVNGAVGIVVAPGGRLLRVLRFTIENGKVVELEVFGDPATLATLELSVLD